LEKSSGCVSGLDDGDVCSTNKDCREGTCAPHVTPSSRPSRIRSDSLITCVVPKWLHPQAVARVFLLDTTSGAGTPLGAVGGIPLLTYFATFEAISPNRVLASASTNVTLVGDSIDVDAKNYECHFLLLSGATTRPATPRSSRLLTCQAPTLPREEVAGTAVVKILKGGRFLSVVGDSAVTLEYVEEWAGLGACLNSSGALCSNTSGSASGAFELQVMGWSLRPTSSYTLLFTDALGNSISAPVILLSPSPDVVTRASAIVPTWNFPSATANVTLLKHVPGGTTIPVNLTASSAARRSVVTFLFSPVLVSSSTDVLPSMVCDLVGTLTGDVISSVFASVTSLNTMACTFGDPSYFARPSYTQQPFTVKIRQGGDLLAWETSSSGEVTVRRAWEVADCPSRKLVEVETDLVCDTPATGSSAGIFLRGFGLNLSATYTCRFTQGVHVEDGLTAYVTSHTMLICSFPIWRHGSGKTVLSLVDVETGLTVPFHGFPGANYFYYSARWWTEGESRSSVAGRVGAALSVDFALDVANSPKVAIVGSGFDPAAQYYLQARRPFMIPEAQLVTGIATDGSVVVSPPTASAGAYLATPLNTSFLQLPTPSFRGYEAVWPFEIYG
ncbi:hypothetical protein T484DRAFT_1769287, partial [Baffinella frigidus]